MTIKDKLKAFIKECREKAAQNEADAKEFSDKHAKGFADCQRWVIRNLRRIVGPQRRDR